MYIPKQAVKSIQFLCKLPFFKQGSFLLALQIICLTTANAALLPQKNDIFIDSNSGIALKYPCSAGGQPLVIYSTPIENKTSISSKDTIFPLYVKPGYDASPLVISPTAQSDEISKTDLIIKGPNPGSSYFSIQFSLNQNGKSFYVNSANLATLKTTEADQYVTSYAIKLNDEQNASLYSQLPIITSSAEQDIGVFVAQTVTKISVSQYSWNQLGKWRDDSHSVANYPVTYQFSPRPSLDKTFYNGYGFWICGLDKSPASNDDNKNRTEKTYKDPIQ